MIRSNRDIGWAGKDTNRIYDLKLFLFESLIVKAKNMLINKSHSNINIGIQSMDTNKIFFVEMFLAFLIVKAKDTY